MVRFMNPLVFFREWGIKIDIIPLIRSFSSFECTSSKNGKNAKYV